MTRDRRPKRMQSQTERDFLGLARLRAERRAAYARDQVDELSDAVGSELDDFEGEDTGITERIEHDPDLKRLWDKITKERSRRANQITKAMGDRPPAEVISKLRSSIRWVKFVIAGIAVPVITTTVLVGKYIYARGETDTANRFERARLLEDVKRLTAEADDLARRIRDAEEAARRNEQRINDLRDRRTNGVNPSK